MYLLKKILRLSILTIVLLTLFSCSNLPYLYQYNPSDDFLAERNIAIMPCNFFAINNYSVRKNVTNATIDAIKLELQINKFQFVEGEIIINSIDSLTKEFSNFFDPKTGIPDTSTINRYKKAINDMVFNKFGVTSILYPYIIVAPARIYNYAFRWHGRAFSIFPYQVMGQASALSLYVKIYDKNQNLIFENAGGIQPLYKVTMAHLIGVNDDEIFKNPIDIHEATKIVFKPVRQEIEKSIK
jgi:hypothetical protein